MFFFLLGILNCVTTHQLINGTYYNITTASGLYQAENNTCGGIIGWGIEAIFFAVIFIVATAYSDVGPGLLVGGGVMTILSLLLQGIGITASGAPILFGGVALLGLIITGLKGFLSPYN